MQLLGRVTPSAPHQSAPCSQLQMWASKVTIQVCVSIHCEAYSLVSLRSRVSLCHIGLCNSCAFQQKTENSWLQPRTLI